MVKKLDQLVFRAFLGPFILTFLVVTFILLVTQMLRYLNEIFGKGIGIEVLAQFIWHFSIFQTPFAIPLAVMLASLICFGNLGEHSELIAIKSAGISLTRIMVPIFIFVLFISVFAFYSNSYLVPKSALKAYSLLYDIRQKKPTLDIKEGVFYDGIDNFRIKVSQKGEDGQTLKGIVIYDHSKGMGNTDVILADSGKMYTIHHERYLKLELYHGNYYSEEITTGNINRQLKIKPFNRTSFEKSEIVFDLSMFDLKRTNEKLFSTDRFMRNHNELQADIDSMQKEIYDMRLMYYKAANHYWPYHRSVDVVKFPEDLKVFGIIKDSLIAAIRDTLREDNVGSVNRYIDAKSIKQLAKGKALIVQDSAREAKAEKVRRTYTSYSQKFDVQVLKDSVDAHYADRKSLNSMYKTTIGLTRQMKSKSSVNKNRLAHFVREQKIFIIQREKLTANAFACVILFLIGAPLGSIIKKGGLGIPVFVSIVFFIFYYVVSMFAEKQARQGLMDPYLAGWLANIILLPFGIFSFKQARKDARILEMDYYRVIFQKLKDRFTAKTASTTS